MRFIDEATISVKAGDGGMGCVSFRREKHVPRGGPNGGSGGRGGDVIVRVESGLTSLLDFRYKRLCRAARGGHGQGSDRTGRNALNLVLKVPAGTVIKNAETGETLVDLDGEGQEFVAATGGRGGKGNAHFATSKNRAPRFAQPGEPGEELKLKLELKLLADVGIIGFPNAGKSTLISRISEARPKIADYPFTTLVPNLGVVGFGEYGSFVIADIPGLVEGAHSGKGIGTRFLKHIERTRLFIHLLDLSPDTGRAPEDDFNVLCNELESYNPELANRPLVAVLNKIDLTEAREKAPELLKFFTGKGIKVFEISAVTGDGVKALVDYVGSQIVKLKAAGP